MNSPKLLQQVEYRGTVLPLVLKALVSDSYKPLDRSSLLAMSVKSAMLLALTSAKWVGEMTTLLLCVTLGFHSKSLLLWSSLTSVLRFYRMRLLFGFWQGE